MDLDKICLDRLKETKEDCENTVRSDYMEMRSTEPEVEEDKSKTTYQFFSW